MRRHLLYRAPALVNLSAADQAIIAALNIRTIIDLRGEREAAHAPVEIPGATRLPLPIEPSVGASLKDILRTGQLAGHATETDIRALLRDAYRAYALSAAPRIRALFEALQSAELPLLIHCSAGKDRTGFAAALLLRAVGVPWESVMRDYLATNRLWRRETARHLNLPPALRDALMGAHAYLLEAAFAAILRAHGSFDAYAAEGLGLTPPRRLALAAMLLGR